jgi:hypothetical protein
VKTLEQLALETVMPDGGETTEYQENEIAALVKFGKLVLENASLPTPLALDLPSDTMCKCGAVNYESHKRWCPANTASQ